MLCENKMLLMNLKRKKYSRQASNSTVNAGISYQTKSTKEIEAYVLVILFLQNSIYSSTYDNCFGKKYGGKITDYFEKEKKKTC